MQITLHEAAVGWLFAHQGEHLSTDRQRLVDRCADYLRKSAPDPVTEKTAQLIALKALGEIESRGNNAHVDIGNSTSFAVFVVDPVTRHKYAFTAADLIRLARSGASNVPATIH